MCKHGDFYTCHDSYNPGYLIEHKWENCFTVTITLSKSDELILLYLHSLLEVHGVIVVILNFHIT